MNVVTRIFPNDMGDSRNQGNNLIDVLAPHGTTMRRLARNKMYWTGNFGQILIRIKSFKKGPIQHRIQNARVRTVKLQRKPGNKIFSKDIYQG